MEIHIHIHDHREKEILNKLNQIIMEQSELAAQLTALQTQTEKAKAEILSKIADLEGALDAALDAADDVTPEVQAAFDALKASVQGVDDIVADPTV
jgi:chromosome segregation ATPase